MELFGARVVDAYEETFSLFSQNLPSNDLGFVDSKSDTIEIEIGGRDVSLKQSPGLLLSQRKSGTTGAVLWKVTPRITAWLVSMPSVLQETGLLTRESTILELGCGATGMIGISLAPIIAKYVLTDQTYVSKKVQENIDANRKSAETKRSLGRKTQYKVPLFVSLDWELDTPSRQSFSMGNTEVIDLIIACDCVYNEHLIEPLIRTAREICHFQEETSRKQTALLIAQQLRSESIFNEFLDVLLQSFDVWRVADSHLPLDLSSASGYVVHLAWLKGRYQHSSTHPAC